MTSLLLLISLNAFATSMAPERPPEPTAVTEEAQKVLTTYENDVAEARRSFEKATAHHRQKAIRELETLQDRYTKAGKLDEAVAVRDRVRALKNIETPASWRAPTDADLGRVIELTVVGSTTGPIWGVGPYTSDSNPASAAVHAGLVKVGEQKDLRLEVIPGLTAYEGNERNGVTAQKYGPWSPAYRFVK